MNRNNIELRLLIKGRPISEYFHNGQHYVEGRGGSEFEIEIVNRNHFRVQTIVSVDGLSVLDGKTASDQSPGFLLEANSTLRVPGWKVDGATAAKFFFAGKGSGQTYEGQMTGQTRNGGVIGLLAYKEQVTVSNNFTTFGGAFPGGGVYPKGGNVLRSRGIGMGVAPQSLTGDFYGGYTPTSYNMAVGSVTSSNATLSNHVQTSMVPEIAQASAAPAQVNNLGTGFGGATEFATTEVTFNRGDMLCVAVIYYDDARGLKARGIQIARPSRVRYAQQPQAFPGMQNGCPTPPGWQG